MFHNNLNDQIFGIAKRKNNVSQTSNATGEPIIAPVLNTKEGMQREEFLEKTANTLLEIADKNPDALRSLLLKEGVRLDTQDKGLLFAEAVDWLENCENPESYYKVFALHPDRELIEEAVSLLEKKDEKELEPVVVEPETQGTTSPTLDLSIVRESEEKIRECVNGEFASLREELKSLKPKKAVPTMQSTAPTTEKGYVTIKTDYLVYGGVALVVAVIIGYFIYNK